MAAVVERLSETRLKAARACARLHHIEYVQGYRPVVKAEELRFGELFDAGQNAWWSAPPAERLEAALAAVAKAADPFDRVRAEELLRAYHLRWADEPYDVLAVQARFDTELVNPETGAASRTWRLVGAIDTVLRDQRDGQELIREGKTSSSDITPGSEYWRRLRMDGQVSIYYEGGRSLGFDVSRCLYDVVLKPGLRPLKATPVEQRKYVKATGALYANQRDHDETPEEFRVRLVEAIAAAPDSFFARGEVVRLEAEMDEWLFDVWQLGKQIRESQLANRAPRNPDACTRYGRVCPYFDVCTGVASLEDPALFTRRTEQPKEEAAA
jgi:hypothetical protein